MNLDSILDQLMHDDTAPCDVAELALWLARDEYGNLDVDAYLSELNGMAHEAKRYVRGSLEARVNGLCRYLFHEMGFRGNTQEYYDPRNSYMNEVMDRHTGIPITLSVLALAVGQRAGLKMAGIALPGHFIVKAVSKSREVLFDPYHGGRQLTLTDCENLVYQTTGISITATAEVLTPVPLRLMIHRMLSNLKAVYLGTKDFARAVRVIERLRKLDPRDILQRRDLGLSLVQANRPGPAINHLQAYLAALPNGADADEVRKFLNRALAHVGKWN